MARSAGCRRFYEASRRRLGEISRGPMPRRLVMAAVLLVAAVYAAAYGVPLPQRLTAEPSTVVAFSDGSPAHVFLSADEKFRIALDPRDLERVDPRYLDALLRFEDKRFDDVIVAFAEGYADRTAEDYARLTAAIEDGAIKVVREVW